MKSIWHKAGFHEAIDDKLKVSKDGKWVYWTMYGWNISGKDVHDIGCEWAYLDDLLALETELIKTKQALDVAVDAMKSAQRYICSDKKSYQIIQTAIEQITESPAEDVQKKMTPEEFAELELLVNATFK